VSSDPVPRVAMELRLRVGGRIRDLRREHRWSQEKLAERAGIARHSVYRTELATHSASLDHLTLIAHALGVPLSQLVRE
jgi:transcriptional regulator with XRE-family HTH domain